MEDIKINGLTADEWEEMANPPAVSDDELTQMGIMQFSSNQPEQPQANIEPPQKAERDDYEDLGYWQTVGDEFMAAGVEATKFFVPKKYELNYTPRTKAGEAYQTFFKYLYGIGGLLVGGEVAAGAKGIALAANAPKAAKIAGGAEAVLKGNKFFKTGSSALAKKLGVGALNIGTQGVMQGAILDATIHDPDEGRMADLFGDTNNKFIDWLQTDENDTTATAKLKNVVDGALFSMGINGVFSAAEPVMTRMLKNVKLFKKTAPDTTEAVELAGDIIQDQQTLGKIADTTDLVDTVKGIKEQAEINGDDASEVIINTLHPNNIEDGQNILKMLDDGHDIYINNDGSFAIKIEKWEDAANLTPEQYKEQLDALDALNGETNVGNTAIKFQDDAVKSAWTNRGWIGEYEDLTNKNANKIAKNYKDKWEIDNNIKVEFVDGLTIKGKAVEGNTQATKFLGKKAKNTQNAIDKKSLQVQKLQDKVTMLEGTNTPVMEELDIAKEELRIAQNELKDLQKSAKNLNNKPNITIQIDKNARNPYATLRSELEHARDIAKGEVPDQNVRHFSRYEGMNEGEAAVGYTYKKAQSRASQNTIKDGQTVSNELKYNQEIINGQTGTNTTNARVAETIGTNGSNGRLSSTTDEGIRPYTRRSNDGSQSGLVIHEPSPEFKTKLEAQGYKVNNYQELAANSDESAASFISDFRKANKINGKVSAQVYEYSAEEYKQMKLFKAENGQSGFAIKQDGDIVSVFSSERGSAHAMIELAIQNGGKKLDCFDTYLPKMYKKHGFVEVRREKWNEAYKPKDWDKEHFKQFNNGEPDVVYMELKQDTKQAPIQSQTIAEPEQLKLDFSTVTSEAKTTDELVDSVVSGKAKITQPDDVQAVVNKAVDLDPEISGTTWQAISEDSEKLADFMIQAEDLGYTKELQEALSMNDVKAMDGITRKVLAIQKLSSHLGDRLAQLGENPALEQKQALIDLIDQIGRYTKETGSASGRNLNARKLINKGVETFGSLRLSQLTKEGISKLTDLLETTINNINLNFTRGETLAAKKEALVQSLMDSANSDLVNIILNDEQLSAQVNKLFDDLLSRGNVSNDIINKKLSDIITEARYNEVFNATRLTDNPETKAKVVRHWIDQQGGLTSYYVHNLLSGIGTLAKNIVSGGLNTVYFPAKKIVAGYLGGGEAMTREGWNTYKNLMSSWKEAWNLGWVAFKNGDGQLSMMKDTMALADSEVFNGFRDWKFDFSTPQGIWHAVQNIHSVMTRAMGASDEFMSQLNYRSIVRAKAIDKADKLAAKFGITDEAVKSDLTDKIFNQAFNKDGKPMDLDSFKEAKDILYQLPLNGQMFDNAVGDVVQVRPQSSVTGLAQNINNAAASNPLLKIMFPFVKTGANILQQNLEHNGIYALLSTNQRQLLMADTREGALARSQVAFGMFSFMTAAGLAISGKVTGSAPSDPKERKALFDTGWKPYSIRFGDKYISYQGYEPIQTILGFAADSVNIGANVVSSEDDAKWSKFTQQVLSTAVNNFLDKAAFRTGLRQLAFITSPDENMDEFQKTLAQTAQGFLPDSSFVRNTSSLGKREMTQPSNAYERIFNNYFNRGLGDYRRDVFGNRQDNIGLLVTNVAPDNSNMREYEELENLSQFGFNPSEISKTIHGTSLKYKDFKDPQTGRSSYDAMQEELSKIELDGKTLQEAVRELVDSDEYQDLPLGVNMNGYKYSASEDTKLNAIREIFVEYNNAALRNVIEEYGDTFIDNKGRTMDEAVEEVNIEKMDASLNHALDQNIMDKIMRY